MGPSHCKIRPKESDSQAKAFSSPSHCVPVTQRREHLGQMYGFHKAHFISLCSIFSGKHNGRDELAWPSSCGGGSELERVSLQAWLRWPRGLNPGSCWQDCCNLLSLCKRATGCLGFLKSLSFKNLSFLKQMCHLKLFTALWKSKRTFEAQLARLYLPFLSRTLLPP